MTAARRVALLAALACACSTHPGPLPEAGLSDAGIDATAEALDAGADAPPPPPLSCPDAMALAVDFCIDRWEAQVFTVDESGKERLHPPNLGVDGLTVVARSSKGVTPQAYISQTQAARACANAGKRLCTSDEFVKACRGPDESNLYPYGGTEKQPGVCNEGKGSAIYPMFGDDPKKWTYGNFNDPRLNTPPSTNLARTGAHERCVSPYGVYDLVGNLHEWGADGMDERGHGRFRGGFYGDAEVNGHGCLYVTKAHEPTYHDYSTGFRCCVDASE
jgi:sulfatase modifying factor 1